jgi:hypothetical protein
VRLVWGSLLLAVGCRFEVAALPVRGADDLAVSDLGTVASDQASGPADLTSLPSPDLSTTAPKDMASPPKDMASAPPDMTSPPPDMVVVSTLAGAAVAVVNANVALATEGTLDWAHWGRTDEDDFDHSATGQTRISNFVRVGTNTDAFRYANDPRTFSWTGGTPTATSAGTTTGIYVPAATAGVQITSVCDGASHTLRVYLTGWQSRARLSARITDNSQTFSIDHSGSVAADYRPVYDLTYRCASPLKLEVTWQVLQDYGTANIGIASATLR